MLSIWILHSKMEGRIIYDKEIEKKNLKSQTSNENHENQVFFIEEAA